MLLLKAAVSAGLLFFFLHKIDLRKPLALLRGCSAGYFSAAIALFLVMDVIKAVKMNLICNRPLSRSLFFKIYSVNLRTYFFSAFLPGDLAGGGVRILLLGKTLSGPEAVSVIFWDKYLYLLSSLLLTAIALRFVFHSKALGLYLLLGAFIAMALPLFLFGRAREDGGGGKFLKVPRAWLLSVFSGKRKWPRIGSAFALSLLYFICMSYCFLLLGRSMRLTLTLPLSVVSTGLIDLVHLLPVTFGGIGLREWVLAGFLSTHGLSNEMAFALSLLFYCLVLSLAVVGGAAWALTFFRSATYKEQIIKPFQDE